MYYLRKPTHKKRVQSHNSPTTPFRLLSRPGADQRVDVAEQALLLW